MFFLLVKFKQKCSAVFSCQAGGRTIILHFLLCIVSLQVLQELSSWCTSARVEKVMGMCSRWDIGFVLLGWE
jgi:hypothetical protein